MGTAWEKIGLIIRREYIARVRQRTFVVVTTLMAVVFVALACAPTIIQAIRHGRSSTTTIAVVDTANAPATQDEITRLDARLRSDGTVGSPITLVVGDAPIPMLRDRVTSGSLDGVLLIGHTPAGDPTFDYANRSGSGDTTAARIAQAASFLSVQESLTRAGIDLNRQAQIFAPPPFTFSATQGQTATDQRSETEKTTNRGLAYILDILLYTTIIVYGMWIAGGVVEEKSNRIMEIMINAATPRELMAGKILGIGAAALTQYLCIIVPGAIALSLQGRIADALLGERTGITTLNLTGLTVTAGIAFIGFFILGFLLYAALYAAAGSMVSRQEEIQQIAGPLQVVVMISFFAALFTLGKPESAVAQVFSFIPFCTPLVMLTRILVGHPAPWEVALSVVILIVSIVLCIRLAARIYRIGILLYGGRATLRTIFTYGSARVAR